MEVGSDGITVITIFDPPVNAFTFSRIYTKRDNDIADYKPFGYKRESHRLRNAIADACVGNPNGYLNRYLEVETIMESD
ncbi:hypothetical protein Lser_V15G38676 [Lactuca serriola]